MNRNLFYFLTCLGIFCMSMSPEPGGLRTIENNTFQRGEFVKYKVHYGIINAGFCSMEVKPEPVYVNGRKCHHLVGKGYSNSTFDLFYKVRDVYESYMDEEALVSWRFMRTIQEGKFFSYTETHFEQDKRRAKYIDRKKQVKFYPTPENIHDVVSALYYARTVYDADALKPGDRISLRNFIDRKTVDLEAELLAREVIKVQGQKYKCLKLRLTVAESGLITDGASITLWVSNDKNKIPIRMQSELAIGSLKADLIEYRNLRHPFEAKIDR